MEKYLVTRPDHDDTTHFLSNWIGKTIGLAQSKGLTVLDLNRERANKSEVESVLKKRNPKLVVFNSHGNADRVTGNNNEPLIVANRNEDLLKSKIIYAISCKSAKELGPKSVVAGAISYSGYDDDFMFVYAPEQLTRPLQDDTAKLFLEPSVLFVKSLIKGNKLRVARKKTEDLMKKNILTLLQGTPEDVSSAKYLWWNLQHFVSHGDLNASIN